ncbi:uncharacterized protein LOC124937974 [Impatiens glandulifera]|uniref:uncharacterized protein LOC124937974 n=1 Tax=Impatiens glandulifera TaxID=253017 RepID=UPI001FB0F725|nr:uncharacterized protein LOC124937974 [Impatiens glandulifera]
MPFPMKIQPLNSQLYQESIRYDSSKPAVKSRLRRLFDRQFPSVLRISSVDKSAIGEPQQFSKDVADFEPSSVCLAKMVQNYIEEQTNEKPSAKCGRNRCNCFNGSVNDSSDDEFEIGFGDSIASDSLDSLKSLIPCATVSERNLLADASKIIDKNKNCKRKDDLRKILTNDLLLLGYDASVCKSRWEKSPSYPSGEYEYIDVIIKRERLLIDIDFKSEFEIARSTSSYKTILQALPMIFVGKTDRLQQMILTISEAARQSLKKKGMHIPPWRKAEYMTAKWLSPYTRITSTDDPPAVSDVIIIIEEEDEKIESGETTSSSSSDNAVFSPAWKPPAVSLKNMEKREKVVTGLASLFRDKF